MSVFIAIIDRGDNGYACDEIIGCFDNFETAYKAAESYYMDLIKRDCCYGLDSVKGYRVDTCKLGIIGTPVYGSTHWIDSNGEKHEQMLH